MSAAVLTELDSLRVSLKRIVHAISVIQSAMENNVLADERDASEALFCVWESLYDTSNKISEQIDKEYAIRRNNS